MRRDTRPSESEEQEETPTVAHGTTKIIRIAHPDKAPTPGYNPANTPANHLPPDPPRPHTAATELGVTIL